MILTKLYGAKARNLIVPDALTELTGSAISAAMLHFIIINWDRDKKPLVWFNKPIEHPQYHTGRSWKEKGLSIEDVKYGFGFICTKITGSSTREEVLSDTRPLFDTKGKMVNANHLVLYYKNKSGVPFYELNALLAAKAVELQFNDEWKKHLFQLADPPPVARKKPELKILPEEFSSFKGLPDDPKEALSNLLINDIDIVLTNKEDGE